MPLVCGICLSILSSLWKILQVCNFSTSDVIYLISINLFFVIVADDLKQSSRMSRLASSSRKSTTSLENIEGDLSETSTNNDDEELLEEYFVGVSIFNLKTISICVISYIKYEFKFLN